MTTASKSLVTKKVHDLLNTLNVPLNSYNSILFDFDDTCSYINHMLLSISREMEKNKALHYEARNKLWKKKTMIESLDLKLTNVMVDRDSLRMGNSLLLKQTKIYCNTANRFYGKLTDPYHSSEIYKEQHVKLLPFVNFKRDLVDETT